MFDPHIALVHQADAEYPLPVYDFRPDTAYPEYRFPDALSPEKNVVYGMVREGFHLLGLDEEHYGMPAWNPLGKYIRNGDKVLIKPNFVMHQNGSGYGMDCLITHPSVLAAVIDYALLALDGTGSLMIGDAPIQDCHFDEMLENGEILPLLAFYKRHGIEIPVIDFRNVRRDSVDGIYQNQVQQAEDDQGVLVTLERGESAFDGLSEDRIRNLRVTNYDPRIMNRYHHDGVHSYKINQNVLDADVVITMPKPKTHRYGGITAALKNIVGINANKEMLPHHTVGSSDDGGDCYRHKNDALDEAHRHIDARNELTMDGKREEAAKEMEAYQRCLEKGMKEDKNRYWFGSWYGNDTIWRTIADLNKMFYYADRDGVMRDTIQRKIFIVADMIVGGDHSGPLSPWPVPAGVIAMGEDPLLFDRTICSVMGFDYEKIPQLAHVEAYVAKHRVSEADKQKASVVSNDENWNRKDYAEIRAHSVHYQAVHGWEPVLGYNDYAKLQEQLKASGGAYIFGCGKIGRRKAALIKDWGFPIVAFLDNDAGKWGHTYDDILCMNPKDGDKKKIVLIAVGNGNITRDILQETKALGYLDVMIWND